MASNSAEQPDWPFQDPTNLGTFTTQEVLDGAPILYVTHDYDGDWQFHGPTDASDETEPMLVGLGCMVDQDASLKQLHDLPYGWCAYRNTADEPWQREKNHPFPTFEENGYYLEDAVWLSQYRDDINPPSDEVRENMSTGSFVQLVFRFEAEQAERRDHGVERMWVKITTSDAETGLYAGTVANDPHHSDVLRHGDHLMFHPLHIMAVE